MFDKLNSKPAELSETLERVFKNLVLFCPPGQFDTTIQSDLAILDDLKRVVDSQKPN